MSTFKNVLMGVAIGDSYGSPNEFRTITSLTRDNPMGPELPDKLIITDDTQMTLYLAHSLQQAWGHCDMTEIKEGIQQDFLTYYHDPLNTRAPGATVMSSLGRLNQGYPWQKATSPSSDGSGTVMRTSACAFLPADQWVGITAYAAALTHGSANAIAAAILEVALLRDLLNERVRFGHLIERALRLAQLTIEGKTKFLDVGKWLEGYEIPGGLRRGFKELARLLENGLKVLPDLRKDPWALGSDPSTQFGMGGGWRGQETLVAALLAIDMLPNDPWMALRRAVTIDGDADTVGAVAGALLGAGGAQWPDVLDRFEPVYQQWITKASDYFSEDKV